MRVVSLVPAATEWIAALEAERLLVGRSHACDWPARITSVPAVTTGVSTASGFRGAWEDVDLARLTELAPDVLIVPALSASASSELEQVLRSTDRWQGAPPQVLPFAPQTFKQVVDAVLRLGRRLERTEAAMRRLGEGERRLVELQRRLGHTKRSQTDTWPRIACITNAEPLTVAGRWVPDVVHHAGGVAVFAEKGEAPTPISWDALHAADPDVLAMMLDGRTVEAARAVLSAQVVEAPWTGLRAVRSGRVLVLDGTATFNRAGPRLYRAPEVLAAALYPQRVGPLADVAVGEAQWLQEAA